MTATVHETKLPDEGTTAAPSDVVFTFSYVTWDGAQRRGMSFAQDNLVETLMTTSRVRRLLIANPYRQLPRFLAARALGRDVPFPSDPRLSIHYPTRLRREDPVDVDAVAKAFRAYDAKLRRAARRAGLVKPAVVTMHPLIAGFAPLEWAGPVTFYASDDWTAAPAYRRWWPAYQEAYRRVRESGRALITVSQPIADRVAPTGPARVVPNGVDPSEWETTYPAPDWFTALPGPRLLYVGTLDSRIDVDMVSAVADAFSGGSIVLVGNLTEPDHLAPLARHENVHIRARVSRTEVAALASAADACLIPHTRTRFTEAMSPLKAYEYCAAGAPVVATDLPPLRGVSDRITLVDGPAEFAAATRDAVERGRPSDAERRQFLLENSWEARHGQVLDVVLRADERSAA